MDSIQTASQLVCYGVRDCFYGVSSLKYFWSMNKKEIGHQPSHPQKANKSEPKSIFDILKQCLIFGALFWLGIYVFNAVLIGYCFKNIHAYLLTEEEEEYTLNFQGFLGYIFSLTWTLPLFLVSRVLNYNWYQKLADITCETTGIKKRNTQRLSIVVSDMVASLSVQMLFLIQGYLPSICPFPPIFQNCFLIFHLALLYSLYAFEYKWVLQGWSLDKRLSYVESKWPYFMGFGLLLAGLTSYSGSYLESICLFSIFFPFYVISSTVTFDKELEDYKWPMPIFKISQWAYGLFNCKLGCIFGR